jgi:hypothetical protein
MWMEEVVAHLFSLIFHSFHPSEADYLVSEQFSFYGVWLLVSRPTPHLEDQGILFVWLLPLDLSGMDASTSSYATAGIALMILGALKPHHRDKVEMPSVGRSVYCLSSFKCHTLSFNGPLIMSEK